MNRRAFIGNLAGALAGFAILPPATTYERVWVATRKPVWVIDWSVVDLASLASTPQHSFYDFVIGRQDAAQLRSDYTEAVMRYSSLAGVQSCVTSPSELRRIFKA